MGALKVTLIESGEFKLDGGAMFGIVPKVLWQRVHNADKFNRIRMAARCMLIQYKDRNILVDVGIGDGYYDEEFKKRYGVDNSKNSLDSSLSNVGVSESDITDVIITHLHFDHCGGLVAYKNGSIILRFPNAVHYIQKAHFKHALTPTLKDKGSFIKSTFEILSDYSKLQLLDGETEIIPGVEVLVSNGHTTNMQLVKVNAQGKTFVYCADLIPTSSHINIPYVMAYDNFPLTTIKEKQALLEEAYKNEWTLVFEHDINIQSANITKENGKYKIG